MIEYMKDPVVQEGNPVLRLKASPVAKKDITSPKVAKVIARMKKVLAGENFGVAIAAPQVGESLQIFVIAGKAFEPVIKDDEKPIDGAPKVSKLSDRVFINPKLTRLSRAKREMSEGCLSVRGKYGTVLRHEKATVTAFDETGKAITYHGSGLIGHIFQHECDHLDGILYTDKAVHLEEDADMQGARKKLKDNHGI